MKRVLLLILLCLALTSCTALPAEERAFAVVLAVSRGEEWTAHARIPTYQTGGGYTTVSGTGDTLESALAALDDNAPMRLSLSQLRLLVIHEDDGDIPSILSALAIRPDMRLQAAVAVTSEELGALMEAMQPATGARLSKSLDVLRETRIAAGAVPCSTLADVLRMGQRQSPVLMNATVKDDAIDLLGGWPMTTSGTLTQRLPVEEMQLLSMMMGGTDAIELPVDASGISLRDVSARTTWKDGAAILRLTARAARELSAAAPVEAELADRCLTLLRRLTDEGCDPLGLGRQAIRRMPLAQWPDAHPRTRWTVQVGVTPST